MQVDQVPEKPVLLSFDRGTVLLRAPGRIAEENELFEPLVWDERVGAFRGQGSSYRAVVEKFSTTSRKLVDSAFKATAPLAAWQAIELRPYQEAALLSWQAHQRWGIVCMPTGAGKTRVGTAAMASIQGPALCLVPTRVLLEQWISSIREFYQGPVGIIGDGKRNIEAVTVCTFESAYRNMSWLGDRFQVLVVDEAHHFGQGLKDEALMMSIAPYRLGLTATRPERGEQVDKLTLLIGPVIYDVGLQDLTGTFLAAFRLVRVSVPLTQLERLRYEREYARFKDYYRSYIARHPTGHWQDFSKFASLSQPGREALTAFYRSRRIVSLPTAKRNTLAQLLERHRLQKILVFTADSGTAVRVSKEFLIPVITAEIGRQERERLLRDFCEGRVRALVACKVLNEGVDVPDASVAIILGGSSSGREQIQRIGRLLRPAKGKQALIYELVAKDTHEVRHADKRGKPLVKAKSSCSSFGR